MEITVAETLKALRKERGNTQEDIAVHLGISIQAISKWERGEGYPDITLLPAIASYYNVTVDRLLGCDAINRKAETEEFEKQCHRLLNSGKDSERLELCRTMARKYPGDETVLYWLMYSLQGISRVKNCDEIIDIAEKLLKSTDNKYRYAAIQSLCYTYNATGNYEKAVEYASMIPTDQDLLVNVLRGEELVTHCQQYFWKLCDSFGRKLKIMVQCKEAAYTPEQIHKMQKTLYDMYHLIFSDGDFGFWSERLGRLCYEMALASADAQDFDHALSELREMAEWFEKYEGFASIDHTSPFVNRIHYEDAMVGRSGAGALASSYLDMISQNKRFSPLSDMPEFKEVIERMGKIQK